MASSRASISGLGGLIKGDADADMGMLRLTRNNTYAGRDQCQCTAILRIEQEQRAWGRDPGRQHHGRGRRDPATRGPRDRQPQRSPKALTPGRRRARQPARQQHVQRQPHLHRGQRHPERGRRADRHPRPAPASRRVRRRGLEPHRKRRGRCHPLRPHQRRGRPDQGRRGHVGRGGHGPPHALRHERQRLPRRDRRQSWRAADPQGQRARDEHGRRHQRGRRRDPGTRPPGRQQPHY